jgi:hypothetical protein
VVLVKKRNSDAYINGGFRERYALEHGNRTAIYLNGHKCYKFTYSKHLPYQDGNGAIFDTVIKQWVD